MDEAGRRTTARQHDCTTARQETNNQTDLNVHRSVNCCNNGFAFSTTVLVAFFDRLCLPISPINGILKDSQSKDVMKTSISVITTTENYTRISTL